METIQLRIDGMSCGHCVSRVTKTLSAVHGASVQAVDIGSAKLSVSAPEVTAAAIAALGDAGYGARLEGGSPATR